MQYDNKKVSEVRGWLARLVRFNLKARESFPFSTYVPRGISDCGHVKSDFYGKFPSPIMTPKSIEGFPLEFWCHVNASGANMHSIRNKKTMETISCNEWKCGFAPDDGLAQMAIEVLSSNTED